MIADLWVGNVARVGKSLPSRAPLRGVVLVGLAALEFAWLAWYLAEPLPNIKNIKNIGRRDIARWIFLAQALPHVVPGLSFEQSHLGFALKELSHVEYLPQRFPIVLAAGAKQATSNWPTRAPHHQSSSTSIPSRWSISTPNGMLV